MLFAVLRTSGSNPAQISPVDSRPRFPFDHEQLRYRHDSLDKLWDKLRMMTEIGIHDDHKRTRHELQAMDVCRAQAEFACSWS